MIFNDFKMCWHLFGPLEGSKIVENEPPELFCGPYLAYKCLKSLENPPWPPKGPPGTPKAAQRPPGSQFGAFWGAFSTPRGHMLERCYPPSSPSFLSFFPLLPSLLLSTSSFLPPSFLSFLPPLPSPPGNKDTKKPRTQATKKLSNPETNSSWVGGCPR